MTSPVSSTPVLRAAVIWSAVATAVIAIAGAVIGYAVAGMDGALSALAGAVIAAVFQVMTAVSILIANRWFGDALYVPIFFGIVLGGWLLKIVLFIVAMIVLRSQPWIVPMVFFVATVVSVIAALTIDVLVMLRTRMPHASDVKLPDRSTEPEQGEQAGPGEGPGGGAGASERRKDADS